MDCIVPTVEKLMGELVQAFTENPKPNLGETRDEFYSATASLRA